MLAVHASLPPIHESAILDLFGLGRSAPPYIPLNRKVGWARVDQCQRGLNRKRLTQHAAGVQHNPPLAAHRNPVGRHAVLAVHASLPPIHESAILDLFGLGRSAPPYIPLNRKVGWARVDQCQRGLNR